MEDPISVSLFELGRAIVSPTSKGISLAGHFDTVKYKAMSRH